jgi:hypothetical protein
MTIVGSFDELRDKRAPSVTALLQSELRIGSTGDCLPAGRRQNGLRGETLTHVKVSALRTCC